MASMELTIIHELDKALLEESVRFLKTALPIEKLNFLDITKFKSRSLGPESFIYTFHLDLNTEMQKHQEVSHWASKNGLKEINSYDSFFDDKYSFYNFLLANGIKTPRTEILGSQNSIINNLVIKARHGTEKKDFCALDDLDLDAKEIAKIQSYDDVLLQERIDIAQEYKYLYCNGELYAQQRNKPKVKEFALTIAKKISADYSQKIFSIDIVEDREESLFCLEANLRPAALYQFKVLVQGSTN